ncbi:hypothetical protein WSK_1301 [Novosphingobium sp. Rr 2-17]|nr:hypothetical protein WSK_1301 [Novosphingobium sp. Rr 2-17]
MLAKMFTDHPRAVHETYAEHFGVAARFGLSLIGAGIACLVHAVVPGVFVTRGSDTVCRLYSDMVEHRRHRLRLSDEESA